MHFLAETTNRVALVAFFVGVVDGRQYVSERSVCIKELFKTLDLRNKVFHLGRILCRRHQEEDRIQVALFRNDGVFAQEVGENRGGYAEVGIVPRFGINTRRREKELAGIHEILMFPVAFEVVPFRGRFEFEEAQVLCNFIGGIITPRLAVNLSRHERFDVLAGFHQQLAGFNAHTDAVCPKTLTALAFVHLRVDVKRRKERVEGRGGCMHHESVVEALMRAVAALSLDVAVLLMDLRGLRETGLLLMHGLRDEDARIFRSEIEKQR